jgi:anti-sigma regulatory factor (Ser/Thr protein kinase)
MEVKEGRLFRLTDPSGVGAARRGAAEIAQALGLGETDRGRLALVVTEAATNLLKHAGGGELFVTGVRREQRPGVIVLALDRGPGIANPAEALRDGFSTHGSTGTGLGAIARIASRFDLYTNARGAAVVAEVWPPDAVRSQPPIEIGGVNVPHPAETISGDAWAAQIFADSAMVLVADGLGHGVQAAVASQAAVAAFQKRRGTSPADVLEEIHHALRPTRGAAAAVAAVDRARGVVCFAGIGNIAGTIVSGATTRSVVSHHGTAGGAVRRIHEFTYPWSPGDLLVLHSDGLGSHWTLEGYPGLAARHPALVAAILYRDHRRERDDVTVVTLRETT